MMRLAPTLLTDVSAQTQHKTWNVHKRTKSVSYLSKNCLERMYASYALLILACLVMYINIYAFEYDVCCSSA